MSRIVEALIKYGIAPTAFRAAMRQASADMISDGPGTTAGIHDVGVFYVYTNQKRFVIRDGDIWKCPERTVLKLRPAKCDAVKMTESDDVRIETTQRYPGNTFYQFKSTSKAGNFDLVQPAARNDEVWELHRHVYESYVTYLLCHDTLSEAQKKAIDGVLFDEFDDLQGIRLEASLTSLYEATDESGYSMGNPVVSAEVESGGVKGSDDATYGSEVVAHFRNRVVAF